MNALVLSLVLSCPPCETEAPAALPPVASPAWWLPNEIVCEMCHKQCEEDYREISQRLTVVTGWQRTQLLAALDESERVRKAWYSAWWVAWSHPNVTEEQRAEHMDNLVTLIGFEAAATGDIPLPLSCRR